MSSKLKVEIPKGENPDLLAERRKPSFNVQKLADKLNGGVALRKKKSQIGKLRSCLFRVKSR